MKRIIYLFCITLFIISCKQEKPSNGYTIEGHIDKAQNNAIATLIKFDNNKEITIDSTIIEENNFTLKGQIEQPDMYFLKIDGLNGNLPLLLENAEIKLEIYADSLITSDFSGGKETEYFMNYQKFVKSLRVRNTKISNQFNEANQIQDTAKTLELRRQYDDLLKENDAYELEYMSENNDATLSALILERNLNGKNIHSIKLMNYILIFLMLLN